MLWLLAESAIPASSFYEYKPPLYVKRIVRRVRFLKVDGYYCTFLYSTIVSPSSFIETIPSSSSRDSCPIVLSPVLPAPSLPLRT